MPPGHNFSTHHHSDSTVLLNRVLLIIQSFVRDLWSYKRICTEKVDVRAVTSKVDIILYLAVAACVHVHGFLAEMPVIAALEDCNYCMQTVSNQ